MAAIYISNCFFLQFTSSSMRKFVSGSALHPDLLRLGCPHPFLVGETILPLKTIDCRPQYSCTWFRLIKSSVLSLNLVVSRLYTIDNNIRILAP